MFIAILLFIGGIVAGVFGCFLLLTGLTNGLLAFLISAVLISSAFIIGAILDLQEALAGPRKPKPLNPPPLPRSVRKSS